MIKKEKSKKSLFYTRKVMFMNYNNHQAVMAQGFMSKVYGWMAAGLSVTAGVAYYLSPAVNPQLFAAIQGYLLILMLVQFGIAMYFNLAWRSLSYGALAVLFTVYSGIMGMVLSPIAYIYTGESIFQIFLVVAAMFAVMAMYGSVTKSDLSSMGNILFMGLIGVMIAMFINIFWQSAQLNIAISCIVIGISSMLIAYNVQMLRSFSDQAIASQEDMNKVALLGALSLYSSVINLMIHLLNLFGKRRD
jgi:uncharacterized protein